jgi:hypothetical protein
MISTNEDPLQLVDRLAQRYPDCGRQTIEDVVHRHWRTYDNAAVRAFVPVLVTRQAAAELRRT